MNKQRSPKTLRMVQTAVLTAIIILMAFTPLGYLRIGPMEITFLTIPVVIGAILISPRHGAFLGGVFGLTSFALFFSNPLGIAFLAISPVLSFVLAMVPRIIMGYTAGAIFRFLARHDRTKLLSFTGATLSGALLNTVLFVGGMVLFFGNSEILRSFGDSIIAILGVLVGVNALVEAVVAMIAGTAIAKALAKSFSRTAIDDSTREALS